MRRVRERANLCSYCNRCELRVSVLDRIAESCENAFVGTYRVQRWVRESLPSRTEAKLSNNHAVETNSSPQRGKRSKTRIEMQETLSAVEGSKPVIPTGEFEPNTSPKDAV